MKWAKQGIKKSAIQIGLHFMGINRSIGNAFIIGIAKE